MRNYVFLFLMSICFSCSDAPEPTLTNEGALEHRSENRAGVEYLEEFNDPFSLEEVYIKGTELWVDVSYGGGCGEHDFLVVWPEVITKIYPPDFGVTLYHNANGDYCEALLHKTLKFDLTDTPVGKFHPSAIEEMRLTVVNGSKPEESKSNR